jgi:hypothetical protein
VPGPPTPSTLLDIDAAGLLPGAARLARLHGAELPQRDELCGAFCTWLALRAAGVEVEDQDAVAQAAGSVLAPAESDHAAALPFGETGRRDYRLALPTVYDFDLSGTAAGGLVRAVEELSSGAHVAVPVAGPWSGDTVAALLDVAAAEQEAALVLNVATRFLWGSRPSVAAVIAYLASGDADAGPGPDWDVGHFVGCWGALRGARGTLAVVADTYPRIGWGGVHLQPVERVAAALARDGMMTDGGALVLVPAARADALRAALGAAGFRLDVWDNGSPDARA